MLNRAARWILSCALIVGFLLFGTLRFQATQAPDRPLWMTLSLQVSVPTVSNELQSGWDRWNDMLLMTLGDPVMPAGTHGLVRPDGTPAVALPFTPKRADRIITVRSVWQRLTQLVQVQIVSPKDSPRTASL
jgi:hypothetical protein